MDFLVRIEKLLDMSPAEKAEVMRELQAHFDELYDGFIELGVAPAEAQAEAESHMGSPSDIAARLNSASATAGTSAPG